MSKNFRKTLRIHTLETKYMFQNTRLQPEELIYIEKNKKVWKKGNKV